MLGEFPGNSGSTSEGLIIPSTLQVVAGQVERNIALGFHTEIYGNLGEEETRVRYRANFVIPSGVMRSEAPIELFPVPVIVESRIPISRQHELAGRIKELDLDSAVREWETTRVTDWIPPDHVENLRGFPVAVISDGVEYTEVFRMPYLIFTHDGARYQDLSAEDAIGRFIKGELGSSQLEVSSVYLHHPGYFIGRGRYAAGSRFGGIGVPCLDAFGGKPELTAGRADYPAKYLGALSRLEEIVFLGPGLHIPTRES